MLRTFKTRGAEPILKMFIHSYAVCNPDKNKEIDKIEWIQRNITSKIKGLEGKIIIKD